MKKINYLKNLGLVSLILLLSVTLSFAGGNKGSDKCKTKYPIVLAHGMGAQFEIAWGITHYWNNIPKELKNEGATVYITSVNSMDGTENKAKAFRKQVLEILAISGASKVNIIGHSHGSVYSRYAITNLDGLTNRVASHTSIAGPHRGSVIAELVLGLIDDNILEDVANGFFGLIMNDTNSDTKQNLEDLTRSFMIDVFNPNTPNINGIYYQSYAYRIKNVIGAGMFLPTWPIQKKYEGENDGLVAVESAKWGKFRGVITGGLFGVNHLSAVDMLFGMTPGFDAPAHYVGMVGELKGMGY